MIRTAPRGETVVMSSPSEPVRYRLLDLVLERGLLPGRTRARRASTAGDLAPIPDLDTGDLGLPPWQPLADQPLPARAPGELSSRRGAGRRAAGGRAPGPGRRGPFTPASADAGRSQRCARCSRR